MEQLPVVRTVKGALIGAAVFAALMGLCATPFVLWIIPLMYLFGACAVATVALAQGLLPGAFALLCCGGGAYLAFGQAGALLALGFAGLPAVALCILAARRVPFWKMTGALVVLQGVCQVALLMILQAQVTGSVYQAAGRAAVNWMQEQEVCDSLLVSLYRYGLIGMEDALKENTLVTVMGGYVLSDAARADMLLSLNTLVAGLLEGLVPSLLVSQSIYGGVLTAALPLKCAGRAYTRAAVREEGQEKRGLVRNLPVPDVGMPPFEKWFLPRGWGIRVGVLALGYVLSMVTDGAMAVLGQMLCGVFSAVYTVQGLSTLNFLQRKRGTRRGWRIAAPVLMMCFLPTATLILGLADQVLNLRMLRPLPPQKRPDDDDFDDF